MIQKNINYFLILIPIACAVLAVGYYVLNINRGYNLLDEGFYLLNGANPADTKQQVTSFGNYLHLLMMLCSNIIFLRLSTLILNIFSIFLLSFSFAKIIPNKGNLEKPKILLVMIAATITASSLIFIFPAEPNYNTLSILGSITYYSVLVLLLTDNKAKYCNIKLFLLGFIVAFVLFNKFSTGIILIIISITSYIINSIKIKHFSVAGLLFLISGLFCHLLLYFLFLQNWHLFLRSYTAGFLSMKIIQTHHSFELLSLYYQQLQALLKFSYNKYHIIIYMFVVLTMLSQIHIFTKWRIIRNIICYGMLITFCGLSYKIDGSWGMERFIGLSSFYFSSIALMCLIWLSTFKIEKLKKLNFCDIVNCLLVLLLFFLPMIITVGSNNPIYLQILLSCFVWTPIYILLSLLNSKIIGKEFTYFGIACMSVLSLYYSTYNLKEIPYGLYGNLSAQQYLTTVNNTKLYLDKTSKYIIDNTNNQLKKCSFTSNDYLISLTDVPGLTYAVKARSPSCAWYFGGYGGSDKFTKFCLSLSNLHKPFILLDSYNWQISGFAESQLGNYFKDFSKNYVQCGEIKHIPTAGGVCCKATISDIKIFKPI